MFNIRTLLGSNKLRDAYPKINANFVDTKDSLDILQAEQADFNSVLTEENEEWVVE